MAFTTINDPSKYFQTVLWTGDGNDDRSITFDGNSDDAGYGNFEYDVPAGFYSLCTKNLAKYG